MYIITRPKYNFFFLFLTLYVCHTRMCLTCTEASQSTVDQIISVTMHRVYMRVNLPTLGKFDLDRISIK